MKTFAKNGAWYIEFSVLEGEAIGLYTEERTTTTRADGRIRKYGMQRGLGTDRAEVATALLTMTEMAYAYSSKNAAALRLLRDMYRDRKLPLARAYGLWLEAQGRVGKNETRQLESVLAVRMRIELAPLVTSWDGGSAANARTKLKNMATVNYMLTQYRTQHGSEMCVEHLTARFLDAYLMGLLKEKVKFSGKPRTKRSVICHRATINVFVRWLMTPSAANAAGIAEDQYVLDRNPIDLIQNREISQTSDDRKLWKMARVVYTMPERDAIIDALDSETRAVIALIGGSMLEWGGLYNREKLKGPKGPVLFKRNFLRDKNGRFTRWFYAAGVQNVTGDLRGPGLDKAHTRVRYLEVPDDRCWRIVESYLKTLREDDPFISHAPKFYRTRFLRALKAVGLPHQHGRLYHPFRHTFVQHWLPLVMSGKAGETMVQGKMVERDLDWLKQQAGHEDDSTVLFYVYHGMTKRQGEGEQVLSTEMSRKRRGLGIV